MNKKQSLIFSLVTLFGLVPAIGAMKVPTAADLGIRVCESRTTVEVREALQKAEDERQAQKARDTQMALDLQRAEDERQAQIESDAQKARELKQQEREEQARRSASVTRRPGKVTRKTAPAAPRKPSRRPRRSCCCTRRCK